MSRRSKPYLKRVCKEDQEPDIVGEDVNRPGFGGGASATGSIEVAQLSKRMKAGDSERNEDNNTGAKRTMRPGSTAITASTIEVANTSIPDVLVRSKAVVTLVETTPPPTNAVSHLGKRLPAAEISMPISEETFRHRSLVSLCWGPPTCHECFLTPSTYF
jgi:hypothetical protein